MQTRLIGQSNGKWPFSLAYVSKPLIAAIRVQEAFVSVTKCSPTWDKIGTLLKHYVAISKLECLFPFVHLWTNKKPKLILKRISPIKKNNKQELTRYSKRTSFPRFSLLTPGPRSKLFTSRACLRCSRILSRVSPLTCDIAKDSSYSK